MNSVLQGEERGGRARRLTVFENGTLLVPAVGMGEEGEYTCYAENQGGRDTMMVRKTQKYLAYIYSHCVQWHRVMICSLFSISLLLGESQSHDDFSTDIYRRQRPLRCQSTSRGERQDSLSSQRGSCTHSNLVFTVTASHSTKFGISNLF